MAYDDKDFASSDIEQAANDSMSALNDARSAGKSVVNGAKNAHNAMKNRKPPKEANKGGSQGNPGTSNPNSSGSPKTKAQTGKGASAGTSGASGGGAAGASGASGAGASAAGSAGAKAAASGAAKGGAAAAGASGGAPIAAIVIGVVFFLVIVVMVVMVPSTTFNSWTHINEIQDPIDDDELNDDGTVNGFADGRAKAIEAEAEGVNLLWSVMSKEQEDSYEALKKACKEEGANFNMTLQYMQALGGAPSGSDIFDYTSTMEEGVFTKDQMDMCQLLATYSIANDNLWEKDFLGDPDEFFNMDLSSIDISDADGRAEYIYAYMRNKGLSHNAVCGLLGNLEAETTQFDPTTVNSIGASGIVQWYRGRLSSLQSFAKSRGKPWTDFKTQVDYIWEEFQNDYKRSVYDKLKKSDISIYDATEIVCGYYEVPVLPSSSEFEGVVKARYAYSQKWDKRFSSYAVGGIGSDNRNSGTATSVMLGEARCGEGGKAYGCRPGNQTRKELRRCKWKARGWKFVIRIADYNGAERAAAAVSSAVNNRNIGYDKKPATGRSELYHNAKQVKFNCSKITRKIETSSTPLVCMGINAAGIKINPELSSGLLLREARKINKQYKAAGKKEPFLIYTDKEWTTKRDHLRRGDIIGTGKHSAIVTAAYVEGASAFGGLDSSGINAPTAGARGAIAWARAVAEDNSFAYGVERKAHSYGCYFCKTRKNNTSGKWAKTYCCNPFISAAYAHGANDPKMLKLCKSGGSCDMLPSEGWLDCNFVNLGKPDWSQIQNGDVMLGGGIINHVWMVTDVSKDLYIDAGHEGWGEDTIAEREGAKKSYRNAEYVVRYAGPGDGIANAAPDGANLATGSSSSKKKTKKGIKGALAWAKKIADDDSYTYGSSSNGAKCCTCHPDLKKQFVCTTFVRAAYAHGAGDEEMKKWCKNGSYGYVDKFEEALRGSKNWKYIGKFNKENLRPGDVVFKGATHVLMYYGDNKFVGAQGSSYGNITMGNWYPDSFTAIYRYVGKGGANKINGTAYDDYHVNKVITKNDVEKVIDVNGFSGAGAAQSFVRMGSNSYAVQFTNPGAGEMKSKAYIATYVNGKKTQTSSNVAKEVRHGNGLAYNKVKKELYSVSGWGNKNCRVFDVANLNITRTITMAKGAGSIAYDDSTGQFYTGNRKKFFVLDEEMQDLKKEGTKVYPIKSAQDCGGKDGVIYSCVHSGHGRINMYGADDAKYYGTYEVKGFHELEGVDIDEQGHLYILIYHSGGRNTIYKTKEALAIGESLGADEEDEEVMWGQPGNWRYDMPHKLQQYITGQKKKGKEPVYEWFYTLDENGKKRKLDGVYDSSTDTLTKEEIKKTKRDKIIADATNKGKKIATKDKKTTNKGRTWNKKKTYTANPHKTKRLSESEALLLDQTRQKNQEQYYQAIRKQAFKSKPKLKADQYLEVTLQKKEIVQLGMNAFGVTNKKIKELYGPNVDGSKVVYNQAQNSLALLHSVNDFSNTVIPKYGEDEEDNEPYNVGKLLGSFEVDVVCGCNNPGCKKKFEALVGKRSKMKGLIAGSSCFVNDPMGIGLRKNTIIYNKKFGLLVVAGKMNKSFNSGYMSGAGDAQLVIFGGKNHKEATKINSEASARVNKKGVAKFYHVTGMSLENAPAYTNLAPPQGSGAVSGVFGLPVEPGKYTFTSPYGNRWGRLHAGIDIGADTGVPILATNSGTVTRAGKFGGYGNCVDIDHGTIGGIKMATRYGHMSEILVTEGQRVTKGQVIGKVGNTGFSTGPHLHYEVHENGTAVDPMPKYVKRVEKNSILN